MLPASSIVHHFCVVVVVYGLGVLPTYLPRPTLHIVKKGMLQGGLCRNSTRWIVLQHFGQQVDSRRIQSGYQTAQTPTRWRIGWMMIGRVFRKFHNAWIIGEGRSSHETEDAIQLICFRSSSHKRSTRKKVVGVGVVT
jgi:hypothetical protein